MTPKSETSSASETSPASETTPKSESSSSSEKTPKSETSPGSKDSPESEKPSFTEALFLVGCTRAAPYTYYYRQADIGLSGKYTWHQWVPINLQIKPLYESSDTQQINALLATTEQAKAISSSQLPITPVTPVFALGRLFLFWPEFSKTGVSRPAKPDDVERAKELAASAGPNLLSGGNPNVGTQTPKTVAPQLTLGREKDDPLSYLKLDMYKPQVKYSYLNFGDKWTTPQVNFSSNREDLTIFDLNRTEWKTVGVQGLSNIHDVNKPVVHTTEKRANVMLVQTDGTGISRYLEKLTGQRFAWSFWLGVESLSPIPAGVPEQRARSFEVLNYADGKFVVSITNTVGGPLKLDDESAKLVDQLRELAANAENVSSAVQRVEGAAKEADATSASTDARNAVDKLTAGLAPIEAAPTAKSAGDAGVLADAQKTALLTDARALAAAAQKAATTPFGSPNIKELAETIKTTSGRLQALINSATRQRYECPGTVTVKVAFGGSPPELFEVPVPFDAAAGVNWRHWVVTLTYEAQAYHLEMTVYDWGSKRSIREPSVHTFQTAPLPTKGALWIGRDSGSNGDLFTAYLSNVSVWGGGTLDTAPLQFWYSAEKAPDDKTVTYVREPARVAPEQPGLVLNLPLNAGVAGVKVAGSALDFYVPFAPPADFSNPEQERLVAFFGQELYLLRSDMIVDAQVTVTLSRSLQPVQVLRLKGNQLVRAVRLGIPLEDYGVGDKNAFEAFDNVSETPYVDILLL